MNKQGFSNSDWPEPKPQKDKAGFTKGKWKAKKNALGTWTISTDYEYIGQIDRHFNAQLIASAPDLYEALNDAEDMIKVLRKDHPNGSHWAVDSYLVKIRQALAKARL